MFGVDNHTATSKSVVLPHYIFAAVAFFVIPVLMLFSTEAFSGHYFHPKLLAITHVATLGWATMIIFGALYQLLPVFSQSSLFSNTLAKVTFVLFGSGILVLSWSFWNFSIGLQLQIAACLVFTAISLFFTNVYLTIKKTPEWNIESDFLITSAMWLWLTAFAGLLLAFNFTYVFLPQQHLLYLKVHAHLGIAGWFLLLIMGVASRLVPMFILSQNLDKRKLSWAYYGVNSGLILFTGDLVLFSGSRLVPVYGVLILAGIICFLLFIKEAVDKRVKNAHDIGMKHTLIAFIILVLPAVIAIGLSFDNDPRVKWTIPVYIIYGITVLFGFITTLILGQTFKTLPFIVWMNIEKKLKKEGKTILPKDLYSHKLASWQLIVYISSLIVIITGIVLNHQLVLGVGIVLLLISTILYNINVFKILFFSVRSKKLK